MKNNQAYKCPKEWKDGDWKCMYLQWKDFGVYDFLPQDILPHDTLSLHPDCNPNPNPNTYPNPNPIIYPNPNPNRNLDVEAKCHEIWGCGVKRREVKSPFPINATEKICTYNPKTSLKVNMYYYTTYLALSLPWLYSDYMHISHMRTDLLGKL